MEASKKGATMWGFDCGSEADDEETQKRLDRLWLANVHEEDVKYVAMLWGVEWTPPTIRNGTTKNY